ncbi:malate dehydrogenase [Heyndrickxia shackletonii]|uniref:Malate dehydrogenase n=1 Tax=Heyndrickxia shackletonii TaxID=157838 RepID=A0A0Q3TAV8_9BACI|nr:NAD-dependent malic enzyme [Heyndrickxia shackletonii]KQL51288.1 malate dehydrogenase [Heyndrickxia shackletonii]MBB2481519.1 NAD-dependent malic enzyme [Bacillus sp. APMAM]NEZ01016.1 NAD-dependent malic enzyme [Heyndrickxia shackletonii]RTZ55128.1 NAD-dependent malic enzyme [Bacillus sp. SAJ1]
MAFNNLVARVELKNISFGEVASVIGKAGGDIISIDVISSSGESSVRDITIEVSDKHEEQVLEHLRSTSGVKIINVSDRTFLAHLGGKISIKSKIPIKNRDDLSRVYTPGVARVCSAIHEDPKKAYSLTIKRNTVAVISDGSAVLGLGDIGPLASAPVMEGKAMLFKQLADVDAFPICLDTQDTEEIIQTIKNIAPIFGGINLEDISSPRCFEIEKRLTEELDIPVFHDDQHGTAVVVVAGLLNALKVVGKKMEDVRVVVNGIGAAGVAICKMLINAGVKRLVPVDRDGAIVNGGTYPYPMWQWLAEQDQVEKQEGTLKDVIKDADVFIGVSRGGILSAADVQKMAEDPIVFAMANPNPEISPEEAQDHVRVFATGRSDYPNQINNVLAFPGIYRGALDCRATLINEPMKLAAARAIASVVTEKELNEQYIIPSIFNEHVVSKVRQAVVQAAILTGVNRRIPKDFR